MIRISTAVLAALLAGCAMLAVRTLNEKYGEPDITRYDTPTKPHDGLSWLSDVQPILNHRCVVCHSCYDAPCQLKLSAWEGHLSSMTTSSVGTMY